MAHDVFITYSSKDKETADAVCAALEASSIQCWYAPRNIRGGASWTASIMDGLAKSRIMILIWSANSNVSAHVTREVHHAFNKGITVIPFRIEDVAPTQELEYYLESVQWLDASTRPLEDNLKRLVEHIQTFIPTEQPALPSDEQIQKEKAEEALAHERAAAEARLMAEAEAPPKQKRAEEEHLRAKEERQRLEAEVRERTVAEAARKRADEQDRLRQKAGEKKAEEERPQRVEADTARKRAEELERPQVKAEQEKASEIERQAKYRAPTDTSTGDQAVAAGYIAEPPEPSLLPFLNLNKQMSWIVGLSFLVLAGIIVIVGNQYRHSYVATNEETWKLKQVLTGHQGTVNCVAFSPDGTTLASSSGDGSIKIWDAQLGTWKLTLDYGDGIPGSVAFSPDRKTIASGGSAGKIRLWDVQTGVLRQTFEHRDAHGDAVFSPDGTILAAAFRTVTFWDLRTGTIIRTLPSDPMDDSYSVAFSPDGKTIASENTSSIKLWDVQSGALKHTFKDQPKAIAFSPDGRTIASGDDGGTIRLWDTDQGVLKKALGKATLLGLQLGMLLQMEESPSRIRSITFSPDGKTIATGIEDGSVNLWDVQSSVLKQTLRESNNTVMSVAFSPDGKTLASGNSGNSIRLWSQTSSK